MIRCDFCSGPIRGRNDRGDREVVHTQGRYYDFHQDCADALCELPLTPGELKCVRQVLEDRDKEDA